MGCRRVLPLLAVTALLAAAGCSKTQDTAPDPMRFGVPPVIESVNEGEITGQRQVTCDVTEPFKAWLFQSKAVEEYCDPDDLHTSGDHEGEPKRKTRVLAIWSLGEGVTLNVGGTYTETRFEAVVTDPDSTEAEDNVQLVTASFVLNAGSSGATETSLVVLDDGSQNVFRTGQKTSSLGLGECTEEDVLISPAVTTCMDVAVFEDGVYYCPRPDGQYPGSYPADCSDRFHPTQETCTLCSLEEFTCPDNDPDPGTRGTICLFCETTPEVRVTVPKCNAAAFDLKTGDDVKGDHIFSRGFAFFNLRSTPMAQGLLQDCIAKAASQAPFVAAGVQTIEFTLEAVDKQGNLAEWGQKLRAVIGENQFECTGDACLCCFIENGTFSGPCEDKPGLVDPVNDPSGRCDTEDNPEPGPIPMPDECFE